MKAGTLANTPTNILANTLAICTLSLALPAWAQQSGNPAVASPDTPKTDVLPADHPNTVDQLFARQATIGGLAEVELGKLAASRAEHDSVKQFAKRMTDDHGKSNEALARIGKANRAQLPKSPEVDPEVKAKRAELEKLRGRDFDLAYMAAQIADHQKTAHLLEHEIAAGQDAKVKDYAKQTLPTVMRHLEDARQIHATLVAQAK
jgi:putative membrane protein